MLPVMVGEGSKQERKLVIHVRHPQRHRLQTSLVNLTRAGPHHQLLPMTTLLCFGTHSGKAAADHDVHEVALLVTLLGRQSRPQLPSAPSEPLRLDT
mmetsp:Transcript_28848/g.76095  ORF Transcript_28848/g.76095 Transcript_28848/m.76095 type:complete len:97 (-) Transcript_28848:183-473(-)